VLGEPRRASKIELLDYDLKTLGCHGSNETLRRIKSRNFGTISHEVLFVWEPPNDYQIRSRWSARTIDCYIDVAHNSSAMDYLVGNQRPHLAATTVGNVGGTKIWYCVATIKEITGETDRDSFCSPPSPRATWKLHLEATSS
jgi:hypothetical protein